MADNVELNVGSGGAIIRTDLVGSVQVPVGKIAVGGDGVVEFIVSTDDPLPVAGEVEGQGTAGSPSGGVLTVQGAASMTALKTDSSATTQPISASALPLPSGAATSAKQPALGTAGTPSTDVLSVQGRSGMTALVVDPSAVTSPISAASLPLPTGAATSVKQPALGTAGSPSTDVITVQGRSGMTAIVVEGVIEGQGTAGTPDGGVLTVQGAASMTALKVDPSTVTSPVSATSLPLPSGASTSAKQPALGSPGTASTDVITVQGHASGVALKVDGSATTQPVSAASLPLPSGASTSAKQPALGTAGTPSADVISVQGRSGMTALVVDPSGVTSPISAASLPLPSGAATSVKQPGLGTAGSPSTDVITVQGRGSMTPLLVDASATTQPVSAVSLPLPSGAATAAKQPALGTAGSASADVITVQGRASMVALVVDPSGVTSPVSAASLPLPTGAATAAKQPALGTAGTASADVITVQGRASMVALVVDPSAVTSPISAASLPLPSGASTAAKQPALGTAGTPSVDVITVQGRSGMTAVKVDGSGVTQPVSFSGPITVDASGQVLHVDIDNIPACNIEQINGNNVVEAANGIQLVGLADGEGNRITDDFPLAVQLPGRTENMGTSSVVFEASVMGLIQPGPDGGIVVDQNNPLYVTVENTVDTELPNPATLADATVNPTVPSVGTFLHGYNGTTWDRLRSDTTNGLDVDVTRSALPSGASTSAKQPALGTAGTASSDVISVQGIASMTALKTDGSGVTQPISAAALPLPALAATSTKQPALGTAGSASADVITVQGIASGTALNCNVGTVTSITGGSITLAAGSATIGAISTVGGTVATSGTHTLAAGSATIGAISTVASLATITGAVTVAQGTAANLLCTASQGGTWNVGTVTSITGGTITLAAGTAVVGKVDINAVSSLGTVSVITSTTTSTQFPSVAGRCVEVKAWDTNSANVFVGGSGVTVSTACRPLSPGEAWTLNVSNSNLLYHISTLASQKVSLTVL